MESIKLTHKWRADLAVCGEHSKETLTSLAKCLLKARSHGVKGVKGSGERTGTCRTCSPRDFVQVPRRSWQ